MTFQFTNPTWLFVLAAAAAWVVWLSWKSDVQIGPWRHWTSLALRLLVVLALGLAMAGLQWKKPIEGMTVYYMLDRSQSVPSPQQELARSFVNQTARAKKANDTAGVLVFGSEAAIESRPNAQVDLRQVQAVVGVDRTDMASAIRLGTAAFPETGQKRLVLLSDGNENVGDAMSALAAARPLGVSLDVLPLGVSRGNDVSVKKLAAPSSVKKGQTFDVRIFAQADQAQSATIRLYRNETYLGEQKVEMNAGKNLFTFPQTLTQSGFYQYDVHVEAPGDTVPQNNRATAFATVLGIPRILIVSSDPKKDEALAAALQSSRLDVKLTDKFPETPGRNAKLRRDFFEQHRGGRSGAGGDAAAGKRSARFRRRAGLHWRGPDLRGGRVSRHAVGRNAAGGNGIEQQEGAAQGRAGHCLSRDGISRRQQWARDIAYAALDALGPQDEMGIVLWDGQNRWLFPLEKVGDKIEMGREISDMNPGDMGDFQGPMQMAYDALVKSTANLKHLIVFSDGDPAAPQKSLVQDIVAHKITISTVMIGGHVAPDTMSWLAAEGHGRFWVVDSASDLPQIFVKEASVILKSAIFEEPFKPQMRAMSELVKGIGPQEFPPLLGYVCTTPKGRAEVPLVTQKGDPLLAHWQYGLGRTVAFTSDARAKWAANWLGWEKFQQFWLQVAQWSLRRIEASDFNTEVAVEKGEGHISVEAIDAKGNYRNFLNLQTLVISPKGERQVLALQQTGPGHYEAVFPTKEVGAYLMNLTDRATGQSQALGLSVNYSPEFDDSGPNLNLLRRLAELGGGKILEPEIDNPFLHDRKKTFQPQDLRDWLLKFAILLFPLDVAVRRIQLDADQWLRAAKALRRWLFFWKGIPRTKEADESLAALLSRREQIRSQRPAPVATPSPDLFSPEKPVDIAESQPGKEPPATAPSQTAVPEKEPPKDRATTTSRLLDAKRRAQRRTDRE